MKRFFAVLALPLFLVCHTANAQDARSCLTFKSFERYGNKGQSVTNGCELPLEMVWCLHLAGTPYDCNKGGQYYQQGRVLKAGETYENVVTLPGGEDVRYAACYGGYGAVIRQDKSSAGTSCK